MHPPPATTGPPFRPWAAGKPAAMATQEATTLLEGRPEDSREAAQLVIDTYGEPNEATESLLVWHGIGPWKRVVASRTYYEHQFPDPDDRVLSDEQLEQAVQEGKQQDKA
jgi:hypothetical protein